MQAFLNLTQLVGRQVEERPIVQMTEIHLVEEPIEVLGLPAHLSGERFQGSGHLPAVGPLDDNDHVIVLAEFREVLPPAAAGLPSGD